MPSRLSSLLVRDGLIGVKRMERAFQRQVIYGGALDTILLEMGLIDEASICEYISLATGLPPATPGQMEEISSEATDLCGEEKARAFHVAPLALDGDALRVLVCEPVDFAQLEDLADDLDLAIQPLVVPEFRFHLLFDRVFGLTGNARFMKLAETVSDIEPVRRPPTAQDLLADPSSDSLDEALDPAEATAATAATAGATDAVTGEDDDPWAGERTTQVPTGDENIVTIEADTQEDLEPPDPDDEDLRIVDMPLPPGTGSKSARATMRMSSDAVAERLAAASGAHRISDAYRIVRPARADVPPLDEVSGAEPVSEPTPLAPTTEPSKSRTATDRGADRFSASYKAMNELGIVSGEIAEAEIGEFDDAASGEPTRPDAVVTFTEPPTPEAEAEAARLEPAAAGTLTALSVADATELLERAEERDAIFSLLLRGLSSVTSHVALLTVQGGSAIGRMALRNGAIDTDTARSVLIGLGVPSPFQQVVQSASPYIGRMASTVDEVDEQVTVLCGSMPTTALLLPVALRNRVVAVALGHNESHGVEVTEVANAFSLAQAAANALTRLIRRAKEKSTAMSAAMSAPEATPTNGTPATSTAEPPLPHADLQPPVRDEEIEELLTEIESEDRAVSNAAKRALLGRAAEVVPYLDDRFPGKLLVDRYEVGWRTIRAGQYGHMMDLVVTLGAPCGPMLAKKLGDGRRDVRYYAAVCAAELRPEAALSALVERVFDRDFGVRDIAIHALGGYPTRELSRALLGARGALDSGDAERVMAAANALSVLGDLGAIPALLDVVSAGRDTVEPARKSLRRLTAQDFGSNAKKWRQWWDAHAGQTRVEWMIEALAHKDEALRSHAVDELRTLTGESFGFQSDASKRDRELARREWQQWWERSGRRRFQPVARDERDRATAKLPYPL